MEPLRVGGSFQGDSMRLKANDTFHSSETRTIRAGQEFEVHDQLGKDFVEAGLATVIEGSTDTAAGAAESTPAVPKEPEAKMEEAPENKLIAAPPNKRGPGRPPKAKAEPAPDVEPEGELE